MTDPTRRLATGAVWLYSARWLERAIDLISVLILARILAPEDFGVVAIAASLLKILEGLSTLGVYNALIRFRDEHRALYDTAWTLSVFRGVVLALLMILLSHLTDDPRVSQILLVLALSPLLSGFTNPRFIMFERALVYSKDAVLTLGTRIAAFAVTIAIALATGSYWALVAGMLAGSLVSLALGYLLRPYLPRPSLARFRDLFAFAGWLSLHNAVITLIMETDKIIVGRLLGVVETGYYYMAQRIAVLPTRELVSPLQRILFPSFSELVAEPNRLRGAVVESLNVIATLSLPAGFGFALIAEEFIPLVLGERWGVISPLLVVLTPYLGFRVILSVAIPCALSLGRTRLLFLFSLAYGAVHLPLFIVATAKFGLDGAIWSVVVAGTVHVALNAIMLNRLLGVTPKDIARQLRRPLLAALVMAGAILLFQTIKATGNGGSGDSLADLTQIVLGGVTVYATVLISLWWFEGRPAGFERRLLSLKESRTFK